MCGDVLMDVLVGHPEHELLFRARQVVEAVGLPNPAKTVENFFKRRQNYKGIRLRDLDRTQLNGTWITTNGNDRNNGAGYMVPAPLAYEMLQRCYDKRVDTFRKFVNKTLREVKQ